MLSEEVLNNFQHKLGRKKISSEEQKKSFSRKLSEEDGIILKKDVKK